MDSWTVSDVAADPSEPAIAGLVDLRTACVLDAWGTTDLADPLPVEQAGLRHQRYWRRSYLAVYSDGQPVGAAFLRFPVQDNTHMAEVDVLVHPESRGLGIGSALHDEALARVRAAGRSLAIAATDQREEPSAGPGTLAPSTGSGRVLRSDPGVGFLQRRGWSLGQVERHSELAVPVAPSVLASFASSAASAAGSSYSLVTWETETPDEWLDQFAYVTSRMSTDAPTGDIDWQAEDWDGARIRATEAKARDGGYRVLTLAAVHEPSRTIAAFTALWVPSHTSECVYQGDTLVVPEHRGHRLGMLVKAANLQRLAEELPSVRRVHTWNAEENRWMLAINVALGFRPAGGSGMWQQTVA